MADEPIEMRIDRLESRAAISELCSAYCMACDDRDMARLRSLFTEDVAFDTENGTMRAHGLEEAMTMFDKMLSIRGPSYHWTHDSFISFDTTDPDRATGQLSAHAETTPNGIPSIAALRYEDIYRRTDGRWRIARRALSFLYYIPIAEYLDRLVRRDRFFGPSGWQEADYPETSAGWQAFYSR